MGDWTSDARNGKIFNIFSLVRIGERSGMGLSSLYGVWEKERFAEPSIVESYEPDRTKVMVEFESDDSELGEMIGKVPEVIGKPSEVGVIGPELGEKPSDAEVPEADISSVAKRLGFSAKSVWRAIRAMKEVGLLVCEGGEKGGRWIVKKAGD